MDDHEGRITIIASSTMVHHRARCMICDRPVDHRVVFMTNDARVLHAGCVPDHVKVPMAVLLQAIRRLERMVDRARATNGTDPSGTDPSGTDPGGTDPSNTDPGSTDPDGTARGGTGGPATMRGPDDPQESGPGA
jgi:hypothetical protein